MIISAVEFLCRLQGHSQHPGIIKLSIVSSFTTLEHSLTGRLHSVVAVEPVVATAASRSTLRTEICLIDQILLTWQI